MKPFTYYEAEKLLKKEWKDLDMSVINLNDLTTPKELSEELDISESTANNWLSKRTDISKLGEKAVGYQLMLDLIQAYNRIPKSNIIVQKQDTYEIYSENEDGQYEWLATTNNIKLARTLKEIQKVYTMLKMSADFISTEIETRESCGCGEDELKWYKNDLSNLFDLIHYIHRGVTLSEKIEKINDDTLKDLNLDFTSDEVDKTPELKSDNDDVLNDFSAPVNKTYKGQINTDDIPEGTIIRRTVKKGSKTGEYHLKKIDNYIVNTDNGKKYPTVNSAARNILGYEENVKENWDFYDTTNKKWRKCKYLVEKE